MTADASSHTSWSHRVPEREERQSPDTLFRYAFQEAYTSDYEDHLSSKHQVELGLALAELIDNFEGNAIRSGYVYDAVSSECKRAIKDLDGALTQGVVSVESLFEIDLNNERYFEDGEWKFSSNGATLYDTGYLIDELYKYQREWGTSPAIMAEAGEQCVNEESSALLESLARPKFSLTPNAPDHLRGRGECLDGAGERALSRRGLAPVDLPSGTTGLDNTPDDDPENRRSERSDRRNEVDACFVNPPVEVKCNRDQWAWLTSRARSLSEQWQFLKLVNSERVGTYGSGEEDDDWTVMTSKTLRRDYDGPTKTERIWRDSVLIKAWKGGRYISPEEAKARGVESKARKFKPNKEALEKWTELGAKGGSYRYKAHRRELVRTHQLESMTTDLYDEHGNSIPPLVEDAVKVLQEADHPAIIEALDEAEEAIAKREGAEARDRLTSLRLAKETVKRQVIQSQDGVAQLQNAYEIQKISGRVSFKRGGPQGLLGEVKARAYDIDGIRNFDIKSCHTAALKEVAKMLEELGVEIDVSPWTEYAGKDAVVADTGLPRSLVKVVEHAVKYGAVLPASMEQVKKFYVDDDEDEEDPSNWPAIAQEVKKSEEKGLIEDVDEALSTLHDVFAEMRRVVIEMAEALLDEYYHAHHSGGWMKNECGVSFAKHTYDKGHEQRSKVMAWMLQGLEAAFCHHLTILSADSDAFSVVANEHDGLILRVDDEDDFDEALKSAIETARDRSGFARADLVEKDFADEEDVEELYSVPDDEEEPASARKEDTKTTDPRSAAANRGDSLSREEKARLEEQYSGGRAVGDVPESDSSGAKSKTNTTEPRSGAAQPKSGGAERERSAAEIGMPEPEEVKLE